MAMAPSHLQSAFSRKRDHREAFQPHGLKNYSPNSKTVEPPAKRTQKSTGAANTYTTQVQRVSVKKRKTTYLESFTVTPDPGYTYLPVGFREIKEKCRDECLRQNKPYYVVSVFPSGHAERFAKTTITRNIYRFGWHFPTDIALAVCRDQNLLTVEQINAIRNPLSAQSKASSEFVTDDNVEDLILDLFPNIPDDACKHVTHHAFQRGTKRIGNADDIPFPRKVQLAVLAHIRHIHTEYDDLLRQRVHRNVARLRIEPKCLRVLLKWRGEDDEYEIEERTEDVIVIDDSGDESSDELDAYNYDTNRSRDSPEVKIVSWRQNGREIRNADLPAEYFNPSFLAIQQPRPAQWQQPGQSLGRPPRSMAPVLVPQRESTALVPSRSGILQSQRSGSRNNPVDLTEHQPARHYQPVDHTQEYHRVTYNQPVRHPPAGRHNIQRPAPPRPSAFPQPPTAEAPRLVYDKHGNPFYLQSSNVTGIMSYGLPPPPRAITPDTALPSIERETRPAPAPFSFTGEERRHVPFDFRPPGLAAPFQPQYNTRSGHHHPAGSAHGPIELFEDPLVEHNKRMQPPPLPPPPQHPPPPPPPYRPHYSSQAEHFPSQTPWQPFTYGQPPPPHPEHWRPVAPRLQDHRSPKDPR